MNGLGEFLRAEREKRHITIEQVASATKINVKLLHALENDNYDALPAKPFVRGFVTSYSRYVGLDSHEVLQKFDDYLDEKSGKKFERPASSPHIFVEKEGQRDNSKTMLSLIMGFFLVVGVVAIVIVKPTLKHRKDRAKAEKAKVSNDTIVTVVPPPSETGASPAVNVHEETKKETPPPVPVVEAKPKPEPKLEPKPEVKPQPKPVVVAPVPTPTPVPVVEKPKPPEPKPVVVAPVFTPPAPVATAPTPETEKPKIASASSIPYNEVKHWLIVRAKEDSWVKYTSDDFAFKEFMLRKDKKIYIRARQNIRFKTGNPNGVEISLDHKNFVSYENGMKTLIIPADAEAQYRNDPFNDSSSPTGN